MLLLWRLRKVYNQEKNLILNPAKNVKWKWAYKNKAHTHTLPSLVYVYWGKRFKSADIWSKERTHTLPLLMHAHTHIENNTLVCEKSRTSVVRQLAVGEHVVTRVCTNFLFSFQFCIKTIFYFVLFLFLFIRHHWILLILTLQSRITNQTKWWHELVNLTMMLFVIKEKNEETILKWQYRNV